MPHLFTYLFEFRGGTYISQVRAESLTLSIGAWIEEIEATQSEIQHVGPKTISEIKVQLLYDEPVETPLLLNGLTNAWCLTVPTKKGFGIVNIVKTEIT